MLSGDLNPVGKQPGKLGGGSAGSGPGWGRGVGGRNGAASTRELLDTPSPTPAASGPAPALPLWSWMASPRGLMSGAVPPQALATGFPEHTGGEVTISPPDSGERKQEVGRVSLTSRLEAILYLSP